MTTAIRNSKFSELWCINDETSSRAARLLQWKADEMKTDILRIDTVISPFNGEVIAYVDNVRTPDDSWVNPNEHTIIFEWTAITQDYASGTVCYYGEELSEKMLVRATRRFDDNSMRVELFRECGSVYAMLTEAKSALDATREVQGSIIHFLTGGGKDA